MASQAALFFHHLPPAGTGIGHNRCFAQQEVDHQLQLFRFNFPFKRRHQRIEPLDQVCFRVQDGPSQVFPVNGDGLFHPVHQDNLRFALDVVQCRGDIFAAVHGMTVGTAELLVQCLSGRAGIRRGLLIRQPFLKICRFQHMNF